MIISFDIQIACFIPQNVTEKLKVNFMLFISSPAVRNQQGKKQCQ